MSQFLDTSWTKYSFFISLIVLVINFFVDQNLDRSSQSRCRVQSYDRHPLYYENFGRSRSQHDEFISLEVVLVVKSN